jgi:Ethanolamine utilization protein EutJ (predicted chaperonin)
MAEVVADYTGLQASVPDLPVFVTPIGIALHNRMTEPV